ncbi:MAG TPA: TolC family protein [Candidatus Hydrogenedentes bacterium]|nr:TolC family protein [Candidatus Hydrogenedentota bacterium]
MNIPGRNRFAWLLVLLVGLVAAGISADPGDSGSPPEPLSFEQALREMFARHETLLAAVSDVNRAGAERNAVRSLRLPRIDLEAKQTFLDAPIEIGVDPVPVRFTVQDAQFTEGQVTLSWPVYAGGRIRAANRAAEEKVVEVEAELRRTRHSLITELARRYFGLQLAEAAERVARLKAEDLEAHERRAKRLMEEGIIAKVEWLSARVAASQARAEAESAAADVRVAREGLMNMLNRDGDLVAPSTPLFVPEALPEQQAFLERINADHPVIALVAARQRQARAGVEAERGQRKPTIYLFGMHELVPEDLTLLDPRWAAGVGVRQNLFDGGQSRSRETAAKYLEEKATLTRKRLERDLKTLAVKSWEEIQKALRDGQAMAELEELARENLRVRSRAFEEGLATSLEVVDAVVSLQRARLGRIKAAHDADQGLFRLLEAAGLSDDCLEYLKRGKPMEIDLAEPFLQPMVPGDEQARHETTEARSR